MTRAPSHQTLRRLAYFAAVAEAGSIRGGAERLGLSVPVVSEALSELEAELDVTLAHRTTRRFALTEAGRAVQAASAEMLRQAEALYRFRESANPLSGRLVVTLPVELAADWLSERLRAFSMLHPALDFTIEATDEVVDLGRRMVDVAIRTGYLPPGETAPGRECLRLVCVAARPPAATKCEGDRWLLDIPLLDRREASWFEGRDRASGAIVQVRSERTIVIDNRSAAIAMAREGLGAALVLERSVGRDLAEGRLATVAQALEFGAIVVNYVFRDALPAPAARAFVDFLRGFGRDGPEPMPEGRAPIPSPRNSP